MILYRGTEFALSDPEKNETHALFDSIGDSTIVTPDFVDRAVQIRTDVTRERLVQDVPPWSPMHWRIFFHEMYLAAYEHRDQVRNDGTPYFRHLIGTLNNLIHVLGRTRWVLLLAALWHDSNEDLGKLLESLLNYKAYGIRDEDVPDTIRASVGKLQALVDGVSKIRGASRVDTRQLTFFHIVETVLEHGWDVEFLKSADRLNNHETIFAKPPDRRIEICAETEAVHIPFNRDVLRTRGMSTALTDWCIRAVNPRLMADFWRIRYDRLCKHLLGTGRLEEIKVQFTPTPDKPEYERDFLADCLHGVRLETHAIDDFFMPGGKAFSDMCIDDLRISPIAPFGEIAVMVKQADQIDRMKGYIIQKFDRQHNVTIRPSAHRGGLELVIMDAAYGGLLVFRINASLAEARSKRGILADQPEGTVDLETRGKLERVLREARSEKLRTHEIAKKVFLQPTKVVYDMNGRPLALPQDATTLDVAAKIHSDVLIGAQKAAVTRTPAANVTVDNFEPLGLLDSVPQGAYVMIESCLAGAAADHTLDIRVHPGWMLAATTPRAREVLTSTYLRPPRKRISAQRSGVEIGKEIEYESLRCAMRGSTYADKLAALFGFELNDLFEIIREKKRELRRASPMALLQGIGNARIEPLGYLAEHMYAQVSRWFVCVTLPNEEGQLAAFSKMMSECGINIGEDIRYDGESRVLSFTATSRKTTFELMKGFLTISEHYPDLFVQPRLADSSE